MRLRLFTRSAGHHRRTPEAWAAMEAELDQDRARIRQLEKRAGELDDADRLIERLVAQRDGLQIEADALREAWDELFARYQDVTAISVPAPMDDRPTIRLPQYSPDAATEEIPVSTLWDAHGLHAQAAA